MKEAVILYLLVGTYCQQENPGIFVYDFNTETGKVEYVSSMSGIPNPSYLAISTDEAFVYAVGENGNDDSSASALSFDKESGKLTILNSENTKGGSPCYISVDKGNNFVVTANYVGGNISVFPVGEDGRLSPASQIINYIPNKSHLHTVRFSPDEKYLFATDLGTDKIYRFKVKVDAIDGQFLEQEGDYAAELDKGSGPRHLAFHPNGKFLYCINELMGHVTAFTYNDGELTRFQQIMSDISEGVGGKGSADIHVSPDGRFLYASNRFKQDGIAIYSINQESGELTSVGYQLTGSHPRNFIITPNGKYLLVANRDANNIQIFSRNKETGLLTLTDDEITLSRPVCLKFAEK
jgi:3-carboxymuconate cyclase